MPVHGINTAAGGGNCWGLTSSTNASLYTNNVIVRGGSGPSVAFPPSAIAAVTDGTSNTIMIAEAALATTHYAPPPSNQDLRPAQWDGSVCGRWAASGARIDWMLSPWTGGWANWGVTRCSMNGPWPDEPHHPNCRAIWQQLGSAHPGGINVLLTDGSVRMYPFGTANAIFQLLVRKNDGLVVDLSGF